MAKRREERIDPDYAPEKALALLRTQLERLQAFKGKTFKEVEADEDQWCDRTKNIVVRSFGDPSHHLSQFYSALHAGIHNMMGVSSAQRQKNFEERVRGFDSFLKNCIEELEYDLPVATKGAYEAGQQFQFFADLAQIIGSAKKEVLLVDPYLDEEHLTLYGGRCQDGVKLRVLMSFNKLKGGAQASLQTAGKKLKASRGSFEMRSSNSIHDRVVFVDERVWVTGQSMKDAAGGKPTYIVEFNDPSALRAIYEPIWSAAQVIIA